MERTRESEELLDEEVNGKLDRNPVEDPGMTAEENSEEKPGEATPSERPDEAPSPEKPELKPQEKADEAPSPEEPELNPQEKADEAPAPEEPEVKPQEKADEAPSPEEPEGKPQEKADEAAPHEAQKRKTAVKPAGSPKKKTAKMPAGDLSRALKDESDEDDESDEMEEEDMGLNLFTFLVLLAAAAVAAVYFICTVKTVHVSGNSLYTSEEIAEQVISDDTQLRHNTVFLTLLYMTPWAPKIPFEEKVSVSFESYDTIRITVEDMNIAGYIPYAGRNLYFSPEGIVLENSPLTVKNATFVTGVQITEGEIGKKIASDNETGLGLILEALQILNKYEMKAECLVLSKSGGVIIYHDRIKVQLGRSDYELKISKIAQLRPYLKDRSGTIDLTNYSSSDENIILK